jgi:hypothetical protein
MHCCADDDEVEYFDPCSYRGEESHWKKGTWWLQLVAPSSNELDWAKLGRDRRAS